MYGRELFGNFFGNSFGGLLVSLLIACPSLIEATPVRVPRHATVVDSRSVAASNYTFVIAGAGIAGLTLADRLTEDPNGKLSCPNKRNHCSSKLLLTSPLVSVLVIDAGPLDQGEDGILVPGSYSPWLYFWPNLVTLPEEGLNNRSIFTPAARVVGGGSTINAMVFVRFVPLNPLLCSHHQLTDQRAGARPTTIINGKPLVTLGSAGIRFCLSSSRARTSPALTLSLPRRPISHGMSLSEATAGLCSIHIPTTITPGAVSLLGLKSAPLNSANWRGNDDSKLVECRSVCRASCY